MTGSEWVDLFIAAATAGENDHSAYDANDGLFEPTLSMMSA